MPVLLYTWDTLINAILNPLNGCITSLNEESINTLIHQSEAEQGKVRALLIEGVIDRLNIRDKQQYVQLTQTLLIRLLNKLYSYKQTQGLNGQIINLYNTISSHLEQSLNFIEDFFSNYYDYNEKVPSAYFIVSIEELSKQLELLKQRFKVEETVDVELINILVNHFNRFCLREIKGATYNDLKYQKDLIHELLSSQTLASEMSIREVLFYFNFNEDNYIAYLIAKLKTLTESLATRREKITALRFEQKITNQFRTKLNSHLSTRMPSLKDQINQWIEEEVKFLEMEQTPAESSKAENEPEDKVNTSLSVAKLALLIKLMVLDKMITNRVVAQVLRITSRTVTTLQKENIAFGSLETKYHNPDRGTISAVKDMLFRWINILNKL